jgi:hypothetical protein
VIRRCVVVMHVGLRHVTVSIEAVALMVVATPVGHEQIFIFVYFVTL